MEDMRKYLVTSGVVAIAILGVMLILKATHPRHHAGMYEKVGKGIDEKLGESMAALDKATSRIQTVFEIMKNRKS